MPIDTLSKCITCCSEYTSSVQGLSVSTRMLLNGANNAICFHCAEYVAAFWLGARPLASGLRLLCCHMDRCFQCACKVDLLQSTSFKVPLKYGRYWLLCVHICVTYEALTSPHRYACFLCCLWSLAATHRNVYGSCYLRSLAITHHDAQTHSCETWRRASSQHNAYDLWSLADTDQWSVTNTD